LQGDAAGRPGDSRAARSAKNGVKAEKEPIGPVRIGDRIPAGVA
jgi:hypothetical protein